MTVLLNSLENLCTLTLIFQSPQLSLRTNNLKGKLVGPMCVLDESNIFQKDIISPYRGVPHEFKKIFAARV